MKTSRSLGFTGKARARCLHRAALGQSTADGAVRTPRPTFLIQSIAGVIAIMLAGCATHSPKPAAQQAQTESAPTTSHPVSTDILRAAAAQPSHPVHRRRNCHYACWLCHEFSQTRGTAGAD